MLVVQNDKLLIDTSGGPGLFLKWGPKLPLKIPLRIFKFKI